LILDTFSLFKEAFDALRCDESPTIMSCCSNSYGFSRYLVDRSFQHQKMTFASVGKNLQLRCFAVYARLDACSFVHGDVDYLDHCLGSFSSVAFSSGDKLFGLFWKAAFCWHCG
jgi:hypothetical protein